MNLKISYSKEADKFLKKNKDKLKEAETDELIIEAIRKLFKIEETNIDLKKLKGRERGSFRIRKGDIRIVFSFKKEKILHAMIKTIDFRGNVYK
jgi:mRNA-degrading endonuclease RelE of RelBE toxin-antitoxin system